jgi:hypothetical protein
MGKSPPLAWETLSAYLRRVQLSRGASPAPTAAGVMRCGEPVGPYRLDNIVAERRRTGALQLRGYPKEHIGEPSMIPPGEWFRYVLHEAEDCVVHVDTGVKWYAVEVCVGAAPQPSRKVRKAVPDKTPLRRKHGRGNTPYDDTEAKALAQAEYAAMAKPSRAGATTAVIDRLIGEGHPIAGLSREAWIRRVRRQF